MSAVGDLIEVLAKRLVRVEDAVRQPLPAPVVNVDLQALADQVLARVVVPEPPTAEAIASLVPVRDAIQPPSAEEIAALVPVRGPLPPPTAAEIAALVPVRDAIQPPSVEEIAALVPRAEAGARGPRPAHRWDGTKLQFEQADGSWGDAVDLQGPRGKAGTSGTILVSGEGGAELPDVPDDYFSNLYQDAKS